MLKLIFSLIFSLHLGFLYSNLDEKIGQMLILGFRGTEVDSTHPLSKQIEMGHIGGVILYDDDQILQSSKRNILSFDQIKKLTSQLQRLTRQKLFIAIDQEGGVVSRLNASKGFPTTTSAEILGRSTPSMTLQESQVTAKLLADIGVNLNFAPTVDLNINPNSPIQKKQRSYSENPFIVIDHAKAMIQGHHQYGILTTLKHFPGHGSSDADSHLGFVDITETWSNKELVPYQELIALQQVDLIMSAHVYNKNLDSQYPATLSKKIITELLRNRLGYSGVIITDDLQMRAIRDNYDLKESIRLAIQSGADLLLFANNEIYDEDIAFKVISHVKEMIEQGEISLERIEESYQRLQSLKKQL